MTDQNKDRSQDEGQQSIDRETEQRNRENETGQDKAQTPSDKGSAGEGSFVGSQGDQSSDYLTKSEEKKDFAAQGQGAQDTSASRSDVETGQSQDRDAKLDDGSDSQR